MADASRGSEWTPAPARTRPRITEDLMAKTRPVVGSEVLQEFVDSRGATLRVDREKGIIEGVKVLGLQSKNGRTYPKETAARAVGLYEGAKVNLDHPRGNAADPRSYADRLGSLRNVRVEQGDGGLRGDFHFNPKHPIAEQLLWDAEHAPENVGFSHNVEARTSRKDGKTVVEEIIRVQSVDLVADPATTRGLFESTNSPTEKEANMGVEWTEVTEATLRTNCPDVAKTIAEKAIAEHLGSEAAKGKDAEFKALTEQLDAYKGKEALAAKTAKIDAELTEAKLPKELVSDLFRQQLVEAKDEPARKALIEDRRKLAPAGGRPLSKEQQVAEGREATVTDGKSFASAILE